MRNFLYIFLFVLHVSSVNSYEDPTKFKDIDPKYISVEVNDPKQKVGYTCLLYTSPSPRDRQKSRMPSSA